MTDGLTLAVENNPRIRKGDTLRVRPDVGDPYRATVVAVEGDRLKVSIPGDPSAPVPTGTQTRRFPRDELEAWYVRGDLQINPPERPHVTPAPRRV